MRHNSERETPPGVSRRGNLRNYGLLGGASGIILPRPSPRVNTAARHCLGAGVRYGRR
jgi:hypothetical protein